jgi:RNA polymerase sigma-70 factor (ECF subfamily)
MVPPADDETLVIAAQGGDTKALDALLRRHHDRIYSLCRRLAGNDADALDATQEALMSVVRGIDSFDGRARFSTWLYRVATNAGLDELRRRTRRPVPVDDEQYGLDDRPDLRSPSVSGSVADRLAVDEALQAIAPEFRACVVLRDLCDLDYAEIAEVLDLRPGTVRSRISRGRAALAQVLGGGPAGPRRGPARHPATGNQADTRGVQESGGP